MDSGRGGGQSGPFHIESIAGKKKRASCAIRKAPRTHASVVKLRSRNGNEPKTVNVGTEEAASGHGKEHGAESPRDLSAN